MVNRPMLHSHSIRMRHPITGEDLNFEKEAPQDFQECLDAINYMMIKDNWINKY